MRSKERKEKIQNILKPDPVKEIKQKPVTNEPSTQVYQKRMIKYVNKSEKSNSTRRSGNSYYSGHI